ncbi:RNA polymerase sigma factor [Pontibacter akesuensis]|nr:sigma-70 family RNA polymerase sigma factor [Pontibacter akesuensis]
MQTIKYPVMAADLREALIADREKTLEKLYGKAYPMVLHYVRQHQGSADDAKDLLQEAIILFYEKVMHEQLELTSSATTYIMAICKNYWRRELEKRNRYQSLPTDLNEQLKQEADVEQEQPGQQLAQYVEKLGEKCSSLLISFYYLGQRMEQLAAQLQYKNVRSATVQKFKCLERLRKSMKGFASHDFK